MKMSEAAKAAKRRYMQLWRDHNKDRQRQYQVAYWEKVAKREEAQQGTNNEVEGA